MSRMENGFSELFPDFRGRVWLNASHQGPLPRCAIEAAHAAIELKAHPYNVSTSQPFNEVPARLRCALGALLGAPADEIILGNSASYGMHQLALCIDWRVGDEVLLVEGDFPSTTFPFQLLGLWGVRLRFIKPQGPAITAEQLRAHLTPQTKVFCTTWVHSFTGFALDIHELGAICRKNGTFFGINASQAVGAIPIDIANAPVDAVIGCGFKWLCGPYGTGYAWFSPALLEEMKPLKLYWLAHFTAEDLKKDVLPGPRDDIGTRAYDIFGTANFNNFMPWTASLEMLNEIGIDRVRAHNQTLIAHFLDSLDPEKYEILSPRTEAQRSSIVIITHRDRPPNAAIYETLRDEGIDNSLRRGNLRFAPHLYNTTGDMDRALAVLHR